VSQHGKCSLAVNLNLIHATYFIRHNSMLRDLDWQTSIKETDLAGHWRAVLCTLGGAALAIFTWSSLYPHALGFELLWAGFATGSAMGMILGSVWQLWSLSRRQKTSGRLLAAGILGWGAFAVIALFILLPVLSEQEHERSIIRALDVRDISSVSVHVNGRKIRRIEDQKVLALLVGDTKHAELFYPSHEACLTEFTIGIVHKNGDEMDFKGCILERHPNDVSLTFQTDFSIGEILIPNGRSWLEKFGS